jgi:ABC-type multidrug transport system fused ATPase/permease subunit
MNNLNIIFGILSKFWHSISKRRKIQILLLQGLNILSSIFELISIASIFPFVSAIIDPKGFQSKLTGKVNFLPNFESQDKFILFIVLSFTVLNLLSGAIRIASSYLNTKISFLAGSDIGQQLYKNTLLQDYEYHTRTNSSDIISVIASKAGTIITNAVMPAFNMISSFFIFLFIIISLLLFNLEITISIIVIFLSIYVVVLKLTKPILSKEGHVTAKESDLLMRNLQESFGGIREILLNNSHLGQIEKYNLSERKLRHSQSNAAILVNLPKFIIEPSGLIVLAVITYYLYLNHYSSDKIISILAVLTMSIQRLLPTLQQLYSNWSTITNAIPSLNDTIALLNLKKSNIQIDVNGKLPWNESLALHSLSFKYQTRDKYILKDINLKIQKGTIIGFVGKSGEGKSTLIDLITGLIIPSAGYLAVDNNKLSNEGETSVWRNQISVVSQRIFLFDKSLAENIAFGVDKESIDLDKLNESLVLANLEHTVNNLPAGINTIIGERGIQLSGGQLQRIGLARAFYKEASILILDEATNALDSVTESEIVKSIEGFRDKFTIIMITHNPKNLKICDKVYEVSNSGITEVEYK